MRLTWIQWTQLVAAAMAIAVLVGAARERLRSERHCRTQATIVVDCR